MQPRHPIYIVSKGRWDRCLTSHALDRLGVPHFVVVEEAERDQYAAHLPASATILTLDPRYQEEYDACDDLGMTKSKGPGPARNFVWDHAVASGASWHWVMDDNIRGFWRLFHNFRVRVYTAAIFRAMEDFVDRYDNVAMAGPNYYMFASRKAKTAPFTPNTRIYSCNLIRNDTPYRWRGRYNEDTDLSLRMLKDGWVTIQFNAFLQWKATTQTLPGGNTAEFYSKEGTLPKSQMLAQLHPDVAKLTWRFGRWHHHVDYKPFARNRLHRKPGVEVPTSSDEYGMRYEENVDGSWTSGEVGQVVYRGQSYQTSVPGATRSATPVTPVAPEAPGGSEGES